MRGQLGVSGVTGHETSIESKTGAHGPAQFDPEPMCRAGLFRLLSGAHGSA